MRWIQPIFSPYAMICGGDSVGHRDAIGIRKFGEQRLAELDLRGEIGFGHRVLGRRQQRHREQVDRIDVRGAVDVLEDARRRARRPRG